MRILPSESSDELYGFLSCRERHLARKLLRVVTAYTCTSVAADVYFQSCPTAALQTRKNDNNAIFTWKNTVKLKRKKKLSRFEKVDIVQMNTKITPAGAILNPLSPTLTNTHHQQASNLFSRECSLLKICVEEILRE